MEFERLLTVTIVLNIVFLIVTGAYFAYGTNESIWDNIESKAENIIWATVVSWNSISDAYDEDGSNSFIGKTIAAITGSFEAVFNALVLIPKLFFIVFSTVVTTPLMIMAFIGNGLEKVMYLLMIGFVAILNLALFFELLKMMGVLKR